MTQEYYRHSKTGEVYCYDSKEQRDQFGSADLVVMTNEEVRAYLNPTPTPEQIASIERAWRDDELERSDKELFKVQDGMGTGSVSLWREYRCALRSWPESEFFPDSSKRPVAPDAPVVLPVGE